MPMCATSPVDGSGNGVKSGRYSAADKPPLSSLMTCATLVVIQEVRPQLS